MISSYEYVLVSDSVYPTKVLQKVKALPDFNVWEIHSNCKKVKNCFAAITISKVLNQECIKDLLKGLPLGGHIQSLLWKLVLKLALIIKSTKVQMLEIAQGAKCYSYNRIIKELSTETFAFKKKQKVPIENKLTDRLLSL